MSVRAILFDLGGTLTRTTSLAQSLAELSNSTAINRVKLDRQQLTMFGEKIEQYIGGLYAANQPDQPDWRAVWEAVAGQCAVRLDAEDMEHLCRAHLKQFVNNCELETYSIPLLASLRKANIPLGLVSNVTGPAEIFAADLHAKGLAPFFQAIVWSSAVGYRKPHSRIFQMALEGLNTKPGRQVWMVGDNEQSDIVGGQRMGLRTVKVIRGGSGEQSVADYQIVGSELVAFFQQFV